MAAATLAARFRAAAGADGVERAAHPGRPVGVRVARRDRCAARGAEPRAQRGIVAQPASAPASAASSPAGTTSPVSSLRTRPPAAAPTAVVAITGTPWSKASLTTRPHGSTKSRVGIDGTTTTSEPA